MTDTKQPEALRLAAYLESAHVPYHPETSGLQAAADELRRQQAEIDRLTKHLHGANNQAEEFERKWYLRGDEIETRVARIAEIEHSEQQLLQERDDAEKLADALAYRIGTYFRVDVGEHSNLNDPRSRAMEVLDGEWQTDSDKDRRIAELEEQLVASTSDVEIIAAALAWHKEALDRRPIRMNKKDSPGHSHRVPGVWDGDNGKYAGMRCAQCHLWNLLSDCAAIAQEGGK